MTTCHTQPLSTTNASIVPMSLRPTCVPRSGTGGGLRSGADSAAHEREAQLGSHARKRRPNALRVTRR